MVEPEVKKDEVVVYPETAVSQVHVTDEDGVVHNYVGPQTIPLVTARDGGPYLDEVEANKANLSRQLAVKRPVLTADNINLPVAKNVQEDVEEINTFLSRAPVAPVETTHPPVAEVVAKTQPSEDVEDVDTFLSSSETNPPVADEPPNEPVAEK